eukprot:m.380910 g.380910  ORF g.380910 m.380910 type:complete len:54 (-) comp109311_c0_seq1:4-165(-)
MHSLFLTSIDSLSHLNMQHCWLTHMPHSFSFFDDLQHIVELEYFAEASLPSCT